MASMPNPVAPSSVHVSVFIRLDESTLEYTEETPCAIQQLEELRKKVSPQSEWAVGLCVNGSLICVTSFDYEEADRVQKFIYLTERKNNG